MADWWLLLIMEFSGLYVVILSLWFELVKDTLDRLRQVILIPIVWLDNGIQTIHGDDRDSGFVLKTDMD